MPLIREYTADAAVGGPMETRQARPADTGEIGNSLSRLGGVVNEVGEQIHKREAQSEISDLTAKMAKAHADLTNGLDSTLTGADPTDGKISENFMQSYDDQMDELGSNIQTPEAQRYFERANAQMRSHFQIKSMEGQANLAGHKAVQDHNDMRTDYSSSLVSDPSSFEQVRQTSAMALQAKVDNHMIDANTAQKLQREDDELYAKSALRGWIDKGAPESVKKSLESGQWDRYLAGDAKFQMMKEAEIGIHARDTEAKRKQAEQDQKAAEAQEKTENAFITKLYDPTGLSTDDVIKSNLDPAKKLQYLKLIDTSKDNKIKTDPGVFLNLLDGIHRPEGDPKKITSEDQLTQAAIKGQITIQSLDQLRKELSGRKTEQGVFESDMSKNFLDNIVRGKLTKANPQFGIKDPEGDERYQQFISWFYPEFQKQKAAGKSVQSLLTPGSPDYLGSNLQAYMRSPQEIMKSMYAPTPSPSPSASGSATTPSAAAKGSSSSSSKEPRREGESPADYLKRIGKS
jgi:hypothetical protein